MLEYPEIILQQNLVMTRNFLRSLEDEGRIIASISNTFEGGRDMPSEDIKWLRNLLFLKKI